MASPQHDDERFDVPLRAGLGAYAASEGCSVADAVAELSRWTLRDGLKMGYDPQTIRNAASPTQERGRYVPKRHYKKLSDFFREVCGWDQIADRMDAAAKRDIAWWRATEKSRRSTSKASGIVDISAGILDNGGTPDDGREVIDMRNDNNTIWGGGPLPEVLSGRFIDNDQYGEPKEVEGEFRVQLGERGVFFQFGSEKSADGTPQIEGHIVFPEDGPAGNYTVRDGRGFSRGLFKGRFIGRVLVASVTNPDRWGKYATPRPLVLAPTADEAREQFEVERHAYEAAQGKSVPVTG